MHGAELLLQDGEVRFPVAVRRLPAGAGGLAAIHFIILLILVAGRLGAEAEARSSGPEGPGGGKDVDHEFPGLEAHPLLLGHCPVAAADRAAGLNQLETIETASLPETGGQAAAYRPEEPGVALRVSIQMSPSSVARTA